MQATVPEADAAQAGVSPAAANGQNDTKSSSSDKDRTIMPPVYRHVINSQ
jgi:hypothetical protein